jgi:hypothetical protein
VPESRLGFGLNGKLVNRLVPDDSSAAPATVSERNRINKPLCPRVWEGDSAGLLTETAREPGDRPWTTPTVAEGSRWAKNPAHLSVGLLFLCLLDGFL